MTRSNARYKALKQGASLAIGVDHPEYNHALDRVTAEVRAALAQDVA